MILMPKRLQMNAVPDDPDVKTLADEWSRYRWSKPPISTDYIFTCVLRWVSKYHGIGDVRIFSQVFLKDNNSTSCAPILLMIIYIVIVFVRLVLTYPLRCLYPSFYSQEGWVYKKGNRVGYNIISIRTISLFAYFTDITIYALGNTLWSSEIFWIIESHIGSLLRSSESIWNSILGTNHHHHHLQPHSLTHQILCSQSNLSTFHQIL
jgi:hypothetical protein